MFIDGGINVDYRELPREFLEKMKELLGDAYSDYIASCQQEVAYGLRVNRLKIKPEEFCALAEKAGWNLIPIPWTKNGFYYPSEIRPSRHPWYYAGLYYLQEPSAMTPAAVLPIEPGDRVLDLCAAPGGKSTELAARLQGTGLLFSNDISNSRAKALLKNLELFGAGNICVTSETPEKLASVLPGFFNKILVDAPCSGEGMFRRDPDMVKSYRERGPEYYIPIQRQILREAVRLLAPGGMLLYSTCTFDREEDEGAVRFVLEEFPDMHLVSLHPEHGFENSRDCSGCLRLFPHRIFGEGHFIALLRKEEKETALQEIPELLAGKTVWSEKKSRGKGKQRRGNEMSGSGNRNSQDGKDRILDFLKKTGADWDETRIYMDSGRAYYLPEELLQNGVPIFKVLRCLRTGLFLGEVKRERFEPSQALAMTLSPEMFTSVLPLSSADDRVIRYLKGETILFSGEHGNDGPVLVCVDGFPLGWGRRQGDILKNKYNPGWRWQ